MSLDYALGNYVQGDRLTELNVYMEGTGKAKTKLQTYKTTTDYNWRTETVSIEAVENLVVGLSGRSYLNIAMYKVGELSGSFFI